jgi:hypothetical protein
MDGVVTQTAVVHAAAWKEMFDEFLRERARPPEPSSSPSTPHHEYDAYVDGKPRLDGTRSFLESRGIDLPEGTPDDPPGTPTLYGPEQPEERPGPGQDAAGGVQVYDGTITYIRRSGRGNRHRDRLGQREHPAGAEGRGHRGPVRRRIDGVIAKERGLRGKPAPDTFLAAAEALRCPRPTRSFSRTPRPAWPRGTRATSPSWSAWTGSARRPSSRQHGADIVVKDVAELLDQDGPSDKDAR